MRVLLLTHFFPPQDVVAAKRPYGWARAWTDSGHEVHVVTTENYGFDGPLGYDVPCDGIDVHRVRYAARVIRAHSNLVRECACASVSDHTTLGHTGEAA